MTGYGKSTVLRDGKRITCEVRSLNSKNLDLNMRIGGKYRECEMALRTLISKSVQRGKVDASVHVEELDATGSTINSSIVNSYVDQLRSIQPDTPAPQLLEMALRLPDTIQTTRTELTAQELRLITSTMQDALERLSRFRESEGNSLEKDFRGHIKTIARLSQEVQAHLPARIQIVKDRLKTSLEELAAKPEQGRYEQELIFYLEKLDINEEVVRLDQHLKYFIETMESNENSGKKLGFIAQEIGREINTMGSKSSYAPMQQLVVQMKDSLEQIKEQILNTL